MSDSLTPQDLSIFSLNIISLVCNIFTNLSTVYVCYLGLTYLRDNFVLNENDYPVDMKAFHHPFVESLPVGCHIGANGIFSLLTGISASKLDALGYDHQVHDFDPDIPAEKAVHYFGFTWQDNSITHRFKPTSLYHAFVYYDGYVYQSYRTQRHLLLESLVDAYPLVRMKFSENDRKIFLDTKLMTVSAFNRLCAPSSHPIPLDSNLRCCRLYSAAVNPTRKSININRKLEK